jgi:hypothetical protein
MSKSNNDPDLFLPFDTSTKKINQAATITTRLASPIAAIAAVI